MALPPLRPVFCDQSLTILHQQIPAVTQLGLLALAFARQQCLRIAFSTRGFGSSASPSENLPWDSPDHPADTYAFFLCPSAENFSDWTWRESAAADDLCALAAPAKCS